MRLICAVLSIITMALPAHAWEVQTVRAELRSGVVCAHEADARKISEDLAGSKEPTRRLLTDVYKQCRVGNVPVHPESLGEGTLAVVPVLASRAYVVLLNEEQLASLQNSAH